MNVYELTDGKHIRPATGLRDALANAKLWSLRSGKVISVLHGAMTYTYVYRGREISGKVANQVWLDEELYPMTTYSAARVM